MAATITGHAFALHLDVDAIQDPDVRRRVLDVRVVADRRIASRMSGTPRVPFVTRVNRELAETIGAILAEGLTENVAGPRQAPTRSLKDRDITLRAVAPTADGHRLDVVQVDGVDVATLCEREPDQWLAMDMHGRALEDADLLPRSGAHAVVLDAWQWGRVPAVGPAPRTDLLTALRLVPDAEECDRCESTGRVIALATDSAGETYDSSTACPDCSTPQRRAITAVELRGERPNNVLVQEAKAQGALESAETQLWVAIRALEDAGTQELGPLTTAVGLLEHVQRQLRG